MIAALFITFLVTSGTTFWQIYRGYSSEPIVSGSLENGFAQSVALSETSRIPLIMALGHLHKQSFFDPRARMLMEEIEQSIPESERRHYLDKDIVKLYQRPFMCPEPSVEVPETCDEGALQSQWETKSTLYRTIRNYEKQSLEKQDIQTYRKLKSLIQNLRCSLYDLALARTRICPCNYNANYIIALGECAKKPDTISGGSSQNKRCPLAIQYKVENDKNQVVAYIIENTFCPSGNPLSSQTTTTRLSPCNVGTLLTTPEAIGADMTNLCMTELKSALPMPYIPGLMNAAHTLVSTLSTNSTMKGGMGNEKQPNDFGLPFVADNPAPFDESAKQMYCSYKNGPYSVDYHDFCNGYVQFLPVNDCSDSVYLSPASDRCGPSTGCRKCPEFSVPKPVTGCFRASNNMSYIGWQCLYK